MGRGLDGYFCFYPCSFCPSAVFKPRRGPFSSASDRARERVPSNFGGDSGGETPLPIPNRAVKPPSADGTWSASSWESRSPPVFIRSGRPSGRPFFVPERQLWRVDGFVGHIPKNPSRCP